MAMQLLSVSPALNALVPKLKHDADIQERIKGISAGAGVAADAFRSTMEKEGGEVLVQKSFLMKASSPNDVNITNMKSSLHAAITALQSNKQLIINIQTDIHSNTESCRGRKKDHDSNLSIKQTQIANISDEIKNIDENIKAHEEEAASSETSAAELERRRDDIHRAARKKRKRAGIGGIVGVALAPFTGGLSLGLAAAYAGVNLNDAGDCDRKAKQLREEAASKREHVKQLRSKKETLDQQKLNLEQEAISLNASADELSEASKVLEEVTDFLRKSIDDINIILHVFQEMESAFAETLLQSNSFEIIQNAFSEQTHQISSRAQHYLEMLKTKWNQLETTMTSHCSRSVSN